MAAAAPTADMDEIKDSLMEVLTTMTDLTLQFNEMQPKELDATITNCLKYKVPPAVMISLYQLGTQIASLRTLRWNLFVRNEKARESSAAATTTTATAAATAAVGDPAPVASQAEEEEAVSAAPKTNPYNAFVKEMRPVIAKENPEMTPQDVIKELGRRWTALKNGGKKKEETSDTISFDVQRQVSSLLKNAQESESISESDEEEKTESKETSKRTNAYHTYIKEMRPLVMKEKPEMMPQEVLDEVRDRWAAYKFINEMLPFINEKYKHYETYIKIRSQIEYYFSDSNLKRDKFMKAKISENGFVSISEFLTFTMIKTLIKVYETEDQTTKELIIASALWDSEEVKLTNDYRGVIRVKPIDFLETTKKGCVKKSSEKETKNEIVSTASTQVPVPSVPAAPAKKTTSKKAAAAEPAPAPAPPAPVLQTTKDESSSDSEDDGKTKKKKAIPKYIKTLVWNQYVGEHRAEASCACCRKTQINVRHFHCGHVLAEAKGGDSTLNNLRPICSNCNLAMGTMSMNEFAEKFFGWKVT
jgi:hypothetical protein